jgi:hypothetical protein
VRLIQLSGPEGRRVGHVEDDRIRLLRLPGLPDGETSIYGLAEAAMASGKSLAETVLRSLSGELLDYDAIYSGASPWRILPAIDHPAEPARCMVSGTGLSHTGSAKNRQAMHAAHVNADHVNSDQAEKMTDSMRMFQWGIAGGRPAPGQIGVSPEWFYKGNGGALRAHGETLDVPTYAEDGGEEPEAAGVYAIDAAGEPRRIGMTAGNEFSDHLFEKRNYLYLAASKLRTCAIGPELVVDPDFQHVAGEVAIERAGEVVWSKAVETGESVMCHSLVNLEHHHFKFEAHRRPGDVHVHFFGADAFSFGDGVRLVDGDVMKVQWTGFGRALRNRLRVAGGPDRLVTVRGV